MPIRPPALDDRRYEDLVRELIARIPAHTPEWTNPRTGDPGRTLIDLFAWLGDALLYRANLIPERQRLTFLRLLGQQLRSAQPAKGLVTVSVKPGKTPDVYIVKPGAQFPGTVPFEADDEFSVLPVSAIGYIKRIVLEGEVDVAIQQALSTVQNNGGPVNLYVTTPLFQDVAGAGATDVFSGSQDRAIWFGLFAQKAASPDQQKEVNKTVRNILGGADTGQRRLLNIGFIPGLPPLQESTDNNTSGGNSQQFNILPMSKDTFPGYSKSSPKANVPHIWEATINNDEKVESGESPWKPHYALLDEVADETSGLTRNGVIRLALPRGNVLFAPTNNIREDLSAGVGDRPPRLDDKVIASRLVGWIRLRPRPPVQPVSDVGLFTPDVATDSMLSLPQISSGFDAREVEHLWVTWMGINAVFIEQLQTKRNLIIGESDGTIDQEFPLPSGSVEKETLHLLVEEGNGWIQWERVDDLSTIDRDAAIARDARVYQLDAEAGTVRFGDGVRGMVPAMGRRIMVGQMRSTVGSRGNLPAGSLKKVTALNLTDQEVGAELAVIQVFAFTGGFDSETLSDAEKRIPSLFRHRDRAVTVDDYRTIAFETPGVSVARVEMLPRFKPQQRQFNVPGIISVMALPAAPLGPAPNPRADRPFLEAVHAWVDPRRPLGTEFYVIGCEYMPVSVSIAVSISDGAAIDTTLQAVKVAMIKALWPLAGGGFDGTGWKLGRTLSNRELSVEVARVAGVSEVNGLNLFKRDLINEKKRWSVLGDARDGKEQNLTLNAWQLPELLGVVVVNDATAPLNGDALFGTDDSTTGTNPNAVQDAVGAPVASVRKNGSLQYCTCGKIL